jgi:hypothetical protein
MLKRISLLACLLAATVFLAHADLMVTGSTDGQALAQALAGPGISNVTLTNFVGGQNGSDYQTGFFTNGTGLLPFNQGILLTTGSILNAPGPNNSPSASYDWGAPGDDAYLRPLTTDPNTGAQYDTFDANILEFTFIPTNNVISFQYVFASEEYNEWVNTHYNDVFGFFLNGVNIALVPGTLNPVSIDTINCQVNPAYYRNNDPYDGGAAGCAGNVANPMNLQYDGLAGLGSTFGALPLYATGPVNPGVPNTIRLSIADASDHVYDSAVFLQAGGFVPEPPPSTVPEPSALLLTTAVVLALTPLARRVRTLR